MASLCVWVKVQICIWSSWCHCHSLFLAPVNPDWFYLPGGTCQSVKWILWETASELSCPLWAAHPIGKLSPVREVVHWITVANNTYVPVDDQICQVYRRSLKMVQRRAHVPQYTWAWQQQQPTCPSNTAPQWRHRQPAAQVCCSSVPAHVHAVTYLD